MSTRMLLEEYLGLMREAGELDVFLPMLLTAMDHEVVTTPQTGHRQYGVDLVTRGPGEDGTTRLFIWVIKCGDIDRRLWSVGETSVRHSMQEAGDTYLQTHLSPADKVLPRTIVVATNGAFRQEIELEASTYMNTWEQRYDGKCLQVPGSVLAKWAEQHLLNEYALPPAHRSLLRKALAAVETPDTSYGHARDLVVQLLSEEQLAGKSEPARRKKLLAALRAIRMVNAVLTLWARDAQNVESPYLVAEFSVLHVWARLHTSDLFLKHGVSDLRELIAHSLSVCEHYHEKLDLYYRTESAIATISSENSIVTCRVFDQIGRLGLASVTLAMLGRAAGDQNAIDDAALFAGRLQALVQTHTVSGSPCFDSQSTDISLALLAFVAGGKSDSAREWLDALIGRLEFTKRTQRFAPIDTDSFDDLVAIRAGTAEHLDEFTRTSTLVPMLGVWCDLLGHTTGYERLAKMASELFRGVTFNLWSPDATYESAFSDEAALHTCGVAECLLAMPATAAALRAQLSPLAEIPRINDFVFAQLKMHWLPLLAARHWRKQIPWELLIDAAGELSTPMALDGAASAPPAR